MTKLSPERRAQLTEEAEWRRCASDEVYFLETYVKIRVPGKGLQPFILRDAQKAVLATWRENRYTLALKARQVGYSTLVAAHELWNCVFHADKFVVMLSRTERDAQKLLLKAKLGWKHLPPWLKDRAPKLLDNNLQKMTWANGSSIESLPSASDPARGEAVDEVVVDEWGFLPNAEDAWASIEPITDIGGRVIGISTANGSGNFFHQFYVKAKAKKNQFVAMFYSWRAVSERDDAWYEAKKASMLPWQLHQEYPNDDVECFIKSGNPVFDVDELRALHQPMAPKMRGFLQGHSDLPKHQEFRPADEGPLRIWELPQHEHKYVIGADVAEGLDYGDYSSAHVIDTKTGMVVAKWHGHVAPDLFGSDVLWHLGWFYNCGLAGIEVNNHGLTTCTAIRDKGYPNLYWRTTYDERSLKQHRKIGFRTQVNTKPMLVDELHLALREEVIVVDEETLVELETYVRDADGKTHGSPHDDQVMSLGIANLMRKHSFTPEYARPRGNYMTMGWLVDLLDAEDRAKSVGQVGGWNRR
jgi:hypothetical protein